MSREDSRMAVDSLPPVHGLTNASVPLFVDVSQVMPVTLT